MEDVWGERERERERKREKERERERKREIHGVPQESETIQDEMKILKECRHPNVVIYYGCAVPSSDSLWVENLSPSLSPPLPLSLSPSHFPPSPFRY
jgi:hypothetical protein